MVEACEGVPAARNGLIALTCFTEYFRFDGIQALCKLRFQAASYGVSALTEFTSYAAYSLSCFTLCFCHDRTRPLCRLPLFFMIRFSLCFRLDEIH